MTIFQRVWSICIILILLLSLSACKEKDSAEKQPEPRIVRTMVVTLDSAQRVRSYPGVVKANKSVALTFQVPGNVVEFPIDLGQELGEGDLVAALDDRDYVNQLNASKAALNRTQVQFDRAKELITSGTISRAKYEEIEAEYIAAKAQADIDQKALDDTRLFAPFAGRVAEKYINNYQNVQAKEPIISLQAVDYIDIVVNLPEQDILLAKKATLSNQKDIVTFAALNDREFEVDFKEFSSQASASTQTFEVVLTMKAPEDVYLLPGMTATFYLRSRIQAGDQVFTIPSHAVATDEQGDFYVWKVKEDMTVTKQVVKVGKLKGSTIQVTSGLIPEDRIVTAGVALLSEGSAVRLQKK